MAYGWVTLVIYVVLLIVSVILGILLRPDPPEPVAPKQPGAMEIPIVTENSPISVVFGEVWVNDPAIVWWGDLATVSIWEYICAGSGK